ncbi:MAG: InlB B-repeat-containing protein [Bacilli bacterium]|nr:InlB B-repeat-containing protein [Bacilli bacterium]
MKESLRKLKLKKYAITTIIVLLLVFLMCLASMINESNKTIKISKILTKTNTLSASVIDGVQDEITSNNYDEIKYQIKVNKDSSDTAIITGTLSNNENKYARFKEIKDSVVSADGKTITVTTTKNKVVITVIVENAPYGITFNPKFTINSEDESKSKINVDPVTITGKSVEGTILDEEGTIYAGVELSLLKNGEEVKKTYSKEDGKYVFSLGDIDTYEVRVAETKYKLVRYTEETTDQNRRVLNLVIKEVEPFTLNITKTISKLDLVVNGKKETFNYNDETKVLKSVKNAKTIEGSIYYNIYLKNDGEVKGTISTIQDVIPEGMSFDESKNPGWTKEDNNLFYTPLEGTEINAFEKTSVTLVLDIVKTDEAKTYINTAIAHGDDYKYVVYYLNNSVYKELYVINSEKIENIDPHIENFAGWYTDKNYTNKYNFNNKVTKDLALYGKIENKKYNVTFIDKNPNNDQETVLAIVEVPEGESVELIDHPEYNGYTFKCFSLYDSCYDDDPITGDTELYTSYTINNYEIEYELDGGSVAVANPITYTVRDSFTLNNPTKEGFTFVGWTGTGLSDVTETVTIPEGSTGKRTYTAHYQINRSTLSVDPNGGTYEDNASLVTFTEDYGTLKVLSESVKRGYNFIRYDHVGGGTYQNLTYLFDNDDGTLTAIYEIINYSITYENITDTEKTLLNNRTEYNVETDTFTLNNPSTRLDDQGNNYQDFLGWDDGNGNVSLTVTIPKGSIGNRTYTAVWRENADDYAITYNLNDGVYAEGKTNPSTYTRQTETFTLNNPSKNGYTFLGWTGTGLTGNTTTVTIPKGSAGDRAYTANYEVIPYEIVYHGLTTEEETALRNPTGYDIESASITLNNPTRTGYEFIGWSGTDITDKSTSVVIPTGSTGNREYTANFRAIEYSLSYTLNDGNYETGKSNPDKYTIESDDITLNNPSKNGYTFKGWSGTDLIGNENTTVTIPTGSIGHRSFLANYTPIVYNITYDYDGGNLPQGVTNIDRYTIESDEITFNVPEKEGYTFLHYKEGNNIITSIPTGSTGDKNLKAYYQINKFNVVYHNEDTVYSTDEVDWNTTTTAPSENPTKAHGIFLYWTEDGTNPFDFDTHITTNKDLYAVYEMVIEPVITYTPTLDETTNRTWVCSNSSNDECGDTVTITSGKDDPEYTLYYKIGDGDAVEYTGPFKVYENTIITAFAKKNNIYSPNATEDIINVDSIAPTINNPGTGSMSFNMTVSGTAQDAGSGVKKFTLYVKEKDALVYDDTLTYVSDTFDGIKDHAENYDHTFYGVQDNTEYIVKIVAEDYVGNVSEKEVEVTTHPYVARVVGKNGILWYTVDPDTKEFVLEDGKEFLMFDSIQAAVNYCAEIQCTIQTNPILPVVNESVVIASNQDITIDLDGRGITSNENATFINNGKLQIVDRNPRMNGDEHESIGFVKGNIDKAIINNNIFVLGDGSSEPSETFIYPELDRPIIEGKINAIEQNNEFHFYDGKLISEETAMIDHGEDVITQYSYNVVFTGENDKNIGTLDIVTDPEARIRSTYYAKLKINGGLNAFDSTRSGSFTTEEAKLLSKIKQAGDYGFIYDAVNDEIYSGNQSTANTTALSYLKIDLTDYDKDQFIVFDCLADTYSSSSYGYISVSDSLSTTGNQILRLTGNDRRFSMFYKLEKGKVNYVYFGFVKGGGDVNRYEGFKVSNFRILGEGNENREIVLYNDVDYYPFVKQEDGTYINSDTGISGNTIAHSYAAFDLTNVDEDLELIVNLSITSTSSAARFWMYTSDNSKYIGYDSAPKIMETIWSTSGNYSVTLEKGKLTYLHFGEYNWYSAGLKFVINSMTFVKKNSVDEVETTEFLKNDNDTYTFIKYDYDLVKIKNSASTDISIGTNKLIPNATNNALTFNGSNYAYMSNANLNLDNYEESIYVEFTTPNKGNSFLYMGSSAEKTCIALWSSSIIISNSGHYSTFVMPETIDDGNIHSLLLTYKDDVYKLYYDGIALETTQYSNFANGANTNSYIATRSSGNNFTGAIYNFKIFNKELTPEELDNTENLQIYINGEDFKISSVDGSYYVSNNQGVSYGVAHTYFKIDLTGITEKKYLYVRTSISSEGSDYGYIHVTNSPNTPSNSEGVRFQTSGSKDNQVSIITLNSNEENYIHFRYAKSKFDDGYSDTFTIKEVRLFDNINDAYSFNPDSYTKINNMYFDKPVFNEKVDTVEILKNITLSTSIIVPEEKEVVLDLNGFTLTTEKNDYIIQNKGKLTITDSEFEERHESNVNYITEQSRLYAEARTAYLDDKAEYEEYAGLCDGCSVSDEYKLDHIEDYLSDFGFTTSEYTFDYVSDSEEKEQVFNVPITGLYKLEVWGAQGGSAPSNIGGYGGYSVGETELTENTNIYVNVGGQGSTSMNSVLPGGYNGGGSSHGADCTSYSNRWGASGGGATSIATISGELKDLDEENDKENILIVAGGGGGGFNIDGWQTGRGGSAGGYIGNKGTHTNRNNHGDEQAATGGTQTSGGLGGDGWEDISERSELWLSWTTAKFGLGGSSPENACSEGGGGGGGFYGGGGGSESSGGGGSGYIGNELLLNKKMVCYNCATSTEEDTKTETTTCTNSTPTENCSKSNNGYAKLTYLAPTEQLHGLREQLSKTYSVKTNPEFADYLQGINFDDSVNINTLTPDTNISFNNTVDDTYHGGITTTIASAILNNEYATLALNSGAINLNVNGKNGIENRGTLILNRDFEINSNNTNTVGIYNETNGEIVGNGGKLNVNGSAYGLVNRSKTPLISNININTVPTGAIAVYNMAIAPVKFANINATGAGIGFYEMSVDDVIVTNSNFKSTGNDAFYVAPNKDPNKIYLSNLNLNGTLSVSSSGITTVDNSTLTHVYNSYSYLTINDSTFSSMDNRGDTVVNGSTINGSGTVISNYNGTDGWWAGVQYRSKLEMNDSIVNSTATSATTVVSNSSSMIINNTKFNNIKNQSSTAFVNNSGSYLTIIGNTIVDPSYGTAVNNSGVLTVGENNKNVERTFNYSYVGHQEEFTAPKTGLYKLETWGASGSAAGSYSSCATDTCAVYGGKGAYASGIISLNEGDKLYIHVGEMGSSGRKASTHSYIGSYNGGGINNGGVINDWYTSGTGGGATDISLSSEDNIWTYDNGITINKRSDASYEQRIIVAGGAGAKGNNGGNQSASARLGYGDTGSGGGYYGGSSGTGGSSYVSDSLTNAIMKNGSEEMPDYTSSGYMSGNFGNGHAKITLLDDSADDIVSNPNLSAVNYGITGNGRVIYYDGTITAKTALYTDIEKVAEDYDIYKSIDGEDEVVTLVANANSRPVESGEEEFVAAIGNAKYTTIQNAVNAANNGDEIDLLVDINQQNIVNIQENKTVTIDYNGHKVITYSDKYLFENNGNLTIKDSVNEKPKNTFYGDKYIYNTGTLDLNNIYIENRVYAQSIIDNNEGTITMNDVRLDFGSEISSKKGVANSENGNITVTNSILNMTNANSLFDNNGTLTLKNNTIANNAYGQYIVFNRETGNAMIDGNTYSVSGDSRNGRYLIYNAGNGIIKNTSANVENVYNVGTLHLQDNTIASGTITNANEGLLIIDNGSYSNTFNINGTGKSIDNTDNLYSFIMHDGTLSKTINTNTTGISSIESGTITVTSGYAINNTAAGIIRLGINDGIVESKANTKPVITGKTYGIYTSAPSLVVDIYDGIISGNQAYNATIRNTETGYSIIREYDSENNIETKYLTDIPMFKNVTQDIDYRTIDELNTAISNGLINNDDVIKVYRDITINNSDDPITIPSGLSITFDINGNIVDKNNASMFNVIGELTLIDSVNDSNGIIDSTVGSLFINNGTINISSGKYTSEKASVDTTLMVNNEGATLNISGGTFTKYYDKLSYRLRYSGSILTNYGNANVTGGKFVPNGSYIIGYTRRWVDEGWYDWDQIYTSTVFINKETGVLDVTSGATFEGIISNTWHDTYEGGYWEGSGTNNDGQLIYNYGIATFTGTTTSPAGLGVNTGTLTFNNVDITGFRQINSQGHANFTNSGTFNLIDSHIDTKFSFINNNGGITNIDNSIVESNIGISYIISNGSGDNTTLNINNSELNNKVSGTIITGSADISIKDSILNTKSGTLVSNSSKGLDIDNSTLTTDSGTAVSVSSGTVSVKKNSTVKTSSGVGISLSSSTLTIGEPISDDSAVSKTYPLIKGTTYGISDSGSTINFYDGIIYGKTNPVANAITNIESGYMIINDTEDDYKINYLDRVPIVQNITQAIAVDEKKYYELDDAFSEAVDGDTLQMITNYSNLTIDETAINNNNVTFDLNGFFIRQINDTLITNNGTLKIIDSSQDKTGEIIGISGSKVINNNGIINFNGGKISSKLLKLIIKNNASATLNIRDEAKIVDSIEATLVNNDGTLNIYNGAYLYNLGGSIGSWASSNSGLPMIINNNLVNIIDLNNDNDDDTSSDYDAPWLYSKGNAQGQEALSADVTFDDPIILTKSGATTNIYGGIFNNGSTTSPDGGQIIRNQGTVNIKNLDSYAFAIGLNEGTLIIEDSYLHNFRLTALINKNTLTIRNTTINFYSDNSFGALTGNDSRLFSNGTVLFENVDFIGGNDTGGEDKFINLNGNSKIIDSRISLTSHSSVITNTSNLEINNSSISINNPINNFGRLTVDNSDITSSSGVISNSGTFNLKNDSTITTNNGDGIHTSGTTNIDNSTRVVSTNGYGILLSGGVVNLGEIGGVPATDTPYIEGSTYGIYNNSTSTSINFYDGLVVGTTGPNAIYGRVTGVEGGYETRNELDPNDNKYHEYLAVSANSVAVATVGTNIFAANSSISPARALQNAINFVIDAGITDRPISLVARVDLVNDEFSLVASKPVTINTNGLEIVSNSVYTIDSNIHLNNDSVGGNISRIVADIFDLSYNAKNIVIYELSDGSNLDSLKTYKLYKDDKLVSLSKEELGRYSYKGKNEELTPIKGRLYIDNLSKGYYRLVSNDNKSIEFSIDADGHITGNVVENPSDPNKVDPSSVAKAELTLAHQTGYTRHLYWIITIPIILVLFMLLKLSKKRETN